MPEELKDQGLQQGGESLEPSQIQEGEKPVPSQEEPDQLKDQELDDLLPDQDDRGIPKKNVLSEVLKKVNKLTEDFNNLKSSQTQSFQQPYQQSDFQQQPSQVQVQPKQIIPRSPNEIAEIVYNESQEKYGEALANGTVNYFEMRKFENQRFAELNSLMTRNFNSIQVERNNSENRIKNLYPDLGNFHSTLSQGVLSELNRRANSRGLSAQGLYNQDPYILESITPIIASQLKINAKIQNQISIKPKNNNLPPSKFEGRQSQSTEEKIKPTQEDILFSKRFGIKPESLVKARTKKGSDIDDPLTFIDESDKLLS